MEKKIKILKDKISKAKLGGGLKKINDQHNKGKLTARERINYLLDENSFEEIGMLVTHRSTNFNLDKIKIYGDGVITGYGNIDGRLIYIYAQDFTVFGGSLSESHAKKICQIIDLATKNGAPIIGLNDSGGARIQEGVTSLAGYADIFYRNTRASGVIPQISAIMGPCAGGAVYSPALTDFIMMVEKSSHMFLTGPNVVKTVTHENVSAEDLGGAETHSKKSGVAHFSYQNELELLDNIKKLLNYIPQNCEDSVPKVSYDGGKKKLNIQKIIPENPNAPYDMKEIIKQVVDDNSFFEVHKNFAENLICGFGRICGTSIGIVANQPSILAGVLDNNSLTKGARFVRFCDCFNIPIIVFEDVPGFLPGTDQEWNGIIINGAKLLYAFSEATVPRITIITRKAYGGAYDVMNSKHIGSDINYAWPSAEIAVMGAKGAAEIIFKKEINNSSDPVNEILNKEKEYSDIFANPYIAAERGFIDEIINPDETRNKIITSLNMLKNKVENLPKKKHGNIPL
ncbi:MAG: methylmalonyl-CoA carboxyltransferase [Flavobacteriales bacterium]|nr:methylmalonyl-CoA carboxyltransferase [Flavobacteriales bacterium]